MNEGIDHRLAIHVLYSIYFFVVRYGQGTFFLVGRGIILLAGSSHRNGPKGKTLTFDFVLVLIFFSRECCHFLLHRTENFLRWPSWKVRFETVRGVWHDVELVW